MSSSIFHDEDLTVACIPNQSSHWKREERRERNTDREEEEETHVIVSKLPYCGVWNTLLEATRLFWHRVMLILTLCSLIPAAALPFSCSLKHSSFFPAYKQHGPSISRAVVNILFPRFSFSQSGKQGWSKTHPVTSFLIHSRPGRRSVTSSHGDVSDTNFDQLVFSRLLTDALSGHAKRLNPDLGIQK